MNRWRRIRTATADRRTSRDTRVVTGGRDPRLEPRLRQSAGLSRLDRALSERRGFRRPPRALPIWPPRHADDRGARTRACRSSRGRNARASRCCRPGLPRSRPRFSSVVHAGDHILVTDSAYGPTRNFCDQILTRLGVTTTYYDPLIGAAIARTVPAEHARGLSRIAGLAELRDAGRPAPSPRRRTPRARWC